MLQDVLPGISLDSAVPLTGVPISVWDATDPNDRAQWEEAWREVGAGEIFAHPAYVSAVASDRELPHCLFVSFPGGGTILYAFIVRPIDHDAAREPLEEQLWDIYTPLVYGGPIGIGVSQDEIDVFWRLVSEWAQGRGIVSEIIRFSPIPEHRLPYPGTMRRQAPHIVVDLEGCAEDDVISRLRKSTRRTYRRALESGLTARIETTERGIEDFLEIHTETMDRVGAHERFYIDEGFLRMLHRCAPGRVAYAFALEDGAPVSVELFLYRDGVSYAYLGGTRTDALTNGSTTVASVTAINEARRNGSLAHVLTGGVTNTDNDSLLNFKRGFTKDGDREYFTGEQVFLPVQYQRLCEPGPEGLPDSDFFPYYRAFSG